MALSRNEIKYYLTNFRTRKSYFVFQLLQLVLSLLIVTLGLLSDQLFRQTSVLCLELVLLLLMAVDLFVVRWGSQGALLKNRSNKIDLCIFLVFLATFVFMCLTENKVKQGQQTGYDILIEADDIVLIVIIIGRYGLQMYQMVRTLKNTRRNIECQRKMKDIDLNKTPNVSMVEDHHSDVLQDEIIRQRIQGKKTVSAQ